MYEKVTTELRFCIGCMYFFINDKLFLSEKINQKEDYERTLISYLKYGGVLRFNNICVKTKFFSEGGMGVDRHETNELSIASLAQMYPDYVRIWRRKNGMAEIRLIKFVKKLEK